MKHLKMSEADIVSIRQQFNAAIELARQGNFLSDKFSFCASCACPKEGQAQECMHIVFRPQAYMKILSLLREFDSEIAWHGVIERQDEKHFLVKDILVYPQLVTGTTVNTDQDAYNQFMMHLDDETYNHLHFQAHSHVSMSTTPSSTDLEHQHKIISQLSGEDYYVFMIWNKRLEWHGWIYDFASNTVYEKGEISVEVEDDHANLSSFITSAKELVQKKVSAKKSSNKSFHSKEQKEEDDYFDKLYEQRKHDFFDYFSENGYDSTETTYWEGAHA